MNDNEPSFNTPDCQEMTSFAAQLRNSGDQETIEYNDRENTFSAKLVPQILTSELVNSINSRIKIYSDRIYNEKQAIKALKQRIEDDKSQTIALIQSNDKMKDQAALSAKYCDRIKSLSNRLVTSNITIGKYLALLKTKVKTQEQDSAKFGVQLKDHLDSMKQKWEAVYQKHNSKPEFQQILTLSKTLKNQKRTQTLKEKQTKELRLKLQEIAKYKGYGFKTYQEIFVKIALTKLETLNIEKESEIIRNQITNLERMQVDEPEDEPISENQEETTLIENLVLSDDHPTITTEDDITDITDVSPEATVIPIQGDVPVTSMEDEPAFQSQPSQALSEAASSQSIFKSPSTQTIVSHINPASFPVAVSQGTHIRAPVRTQLAVSVSQATLPTTNPRQASLAVLRSSQTFAAPQNSVLPTFPVSTTPSSMAFSFAPSTPRTPKIQPRMPGFSLESTHLKSATSFNLGLSNTDSTFSGFQSLSNREIPVANTEIPITQRLSNKTHPTTGPENVRSYEECSFLFQPTTPKPQQSASLFGTESRAGPSDSFNFGSFSSTPQETSKYFSNDFLNVPAPQGETFAQNIFGAGNLRANEADASKTVNQGGSLFNFLTY